jgi:peptide/nickel transport system substrate-binding protein
MRRAFLLALVVVSLGTACVPPPASRNPPSSASNAPTQAAPERTLVVAVEDEPKSLAGRLIGQVGRSLHFRRMFNADLALLDDQSNPFPYLAEALPQLNTDSWKVFPDGTMETTYRLRPNLAWHDGTPLTADDFVFSWKLYTTPDLGQAGSLPFRAIASVEAPDDRTVFIRWSQLYVDAGALQSLGSSQTIGLTPMPRSILGPSLDSGSVDALVNHLFWSTEYVGAGPYRLERWEPGAFIETSAFDRHALGIPKIQRVKLLFRPDPNAAVATMLSGEAKFVANLPVPQTVTLMRQWPAGTGAVIQYFNALTGAHFQGRPDMVSPTALRDLRVRQALTHSLDRASINDALYDGQNLQAESLFAPTSTLGQAANTTAVKYPFDLARSAELMAAAGFSKPAGAEFYMGPGGESFSADLKAGEGPVDQALQAAMASGWRQVGLGITESILPRAQSQDVQVKATYSGLQISQTAGGEGLINGMGTNQIPGPNNGWRGAAWNGYSNPEMDRLILAFGLALDPADRARLARDIVQVFTTDLPEIPLFFPVNSNVLTSDLVGPKLRPASSNPTWNMHEWELR